MNFTRVVTPIIPKKIAIPNPSQAFDFWEKNPFPKRGEFLNAITFNNERVMVDRISVFDGNRFVCSGNDSSPNPKIKVAHFPICFDLTKDVDLKRFKAILLKIDLAQIYSIDFLCSRYFSRIFRAKVSIKSQRQRVHHSEIHYVSEFSLVDFDGVVKHLNGDLDKKITEEDEKNVDLFIDRGFCVNKDSFSYSHLVDLHEKSSAWARKQNLQMNKESFPYDLHNCINFLCETCDYLDRAIQDNDVSQVMIVSSHALCEVHKIKLAQRVKNSDEKKARAFKLWEEHYQDKTKESRKRSRVSQRSISKDVGVSVGTLNSWFKDFSRKDDLKHGILARCK